MSCPFCVCLNDHQLLVKLVRDLEYAVFICVKCYKSGSCGIMQTDLHVLVCQPIAEIIKLERYEVTLAPVARQASFREVIERSLYLVAIDCNICLNVADCGVK